MRYIPRRSKVKTEVFHNFGIADLIVALVGVGLAIMIFTSNLPYKLYLTIGFIALYVCLYIPIADDVKMYYGLFLLFKFLAYKKKYYRNFKKPKDDIKRIIPFTGLSTDKFIQFGDYYGMAVEIFPSSFGLLTEDKQNMVINTLSKAIQRLGANQKASIIKTKMPMILDEMIRYEDEKYNGLIEMAERGLYGANELDARSEVFEERLDSIRYLNEESRIIKDHYFVIIFDSDRQALETTVNGFVGTLESSSTPIFTKLVLNNDRLSFLRSTFTSNFDEREIEMLPPNEQVRWAFPESVKFNSTTVNIDNEVNRVFTITDYPLEVGNAWMYNIFHIEETRVVVNITPMDRWKAEKMLDKALMEMNLRMRKDAKESKKIENETQYDTLRELLQGIKNSNENLYEVNTHIVANEKVKKEVRAILRQNGFRYTENFARQIDGFVSSNVSRLDTLHGYARGIQTSTVGAMYPFISNILQDERGFYLGYNSYPVFTNFFMRNNERVNSNMIVIGKSGSGKSFATKTLLTNFAADNTRIFILDPENEYQYLCENLEGKIIDVGSSVNGIFNPFHIYPSLEAEEGGDNDMLNIKLQFMEQFYKLILPGINTDAFETLNSLTVDLYARKGITKNTDISVLKANEFPIFDDLMELIEERLKTTSDQYEFRNLQVVKTYIEKFSTGGRNSNLWNGPTSIETNENFICFNFRSLIINRNDTIANAQMLLVFNYLDNEIAKNRDFNLKYFSEAELEEEHRRIIVAVDEAHVFINKKFPIALDFMAQMAKRIRKYNGMQIIITQNIKDFIGTEEIQQQSTAVINASQYSMIFSLSPNDITDLIDLYRNAGGINEEEQDSIVTARKGQCFLITGPTSRTSMQIEALNTVKRTFEKRRVD